MREKHPVIREIMELPRITPACAGKTRCGCIWYKLLEDHPRVCGKNNSLDIDNDMQLGSPPRVREKLENFMGRYRGFGITPACAGKTD